MIERHHVGRRGSEKQILTERFREYNTKCDLFCGFQIAQSKIFQWKNYFYSGITKRTRIYSESDFMTQIRLSTLSKL